MGACPIKDVVRCPSCGGSDIIYTCEPKCCFNHLCSDCRATFQLVTRKTGRVDTSGSVRVDEPGSSDPSACCAACESLRIAVVNDGGNFMIVCTNCHAELELAYEDIAAG